MMEYVAGLMALLLIFQQWFWMRNTHKLLDKLMSRSYFDYETSKQPIPQREKVPVEEDGPPQDFRILEDIGLS